MNKLLLIFILLFTTNLYSQDYSFKCCGENNSHKETCKNFKRKVSWFIEVDSIYCSSETDSAEYRFFLDAEHIEFHLDRKKKILEIEIDGVADVEMEFQYVMSYWSTDCNGEEKEETSIDFVSGENKVGLFQDYSWVPDESLKYCPNQRHLSLIFEGDGNSFGGGIYLYGNITVKE